MITAMEAPARFTADMVRDEKVKVLQAIRKYHGDDFVQNTFRGQYEGYLQEEGVPAGRLNVFCDQTSCRQLALEWCPVLFA